MNRRRALPFKLPAVSLKKVVNSAVNSMPPPPSAAPSAGSSSRHSILLLGQFCLAASLSGFGASNIGFRLALVLGTYIKLHGLGEMTGEQGGYRLDPAHPRDTELGPDYAFVRADRVPPRTSPEYMKALQLAPDLAIEVTAENQYAPGMAVKAKTYLSFGTRLVWVVWPRYQRVDVWRPGDETPTPLGVTDALSGEDVVPDFTYPLADLFI